MFPEVLDVFGAFLAEEVDDLLSVGSLSDDHGRLLLLVLVVDVGSLVNQELRRVEFLTPH